MFLTCQRYFRMVLPSSPLLLLWVGSLLCSHWIFCEKGPLLSFSLLSLGWYCSCFLYVTRIQCSWQAPG